MCGIAGYRGNKTIDPKRIEATLELMKRRGPDNRSFKSFSQNGVNTYLLHSRLNIIDLDRRSDQPFIFGDKVIVLNGELYNYVELREDLKKEGLFFETSSDTEVMIKALAVWGEPALDKMEGMWAFALYDKIDGSLMLCRDRFGEKPLYILRKNDGFYFGSEMKLLQALSGHRMEVNNNHLLRYMVHGYKALYKTDEKFYKDVQEISRATLLFVSSAGEETVRRYWNHGFAPDEKMTYHDAVAGVRQRLVRSVGLRLRADVPLAFCMSGGVDSNSLISIARKEFGYDVHGFTIYNSDNRYDESELVELSVRELDIKHHRISLSTDNFLDNLRSIIKYHDEPVHTISYYAHFLLMRAIAKTGYHISVSGTAADELLTGYYDHYLAYLYEVRNRPEFFDPFEKAWQAHIAPIVRNPFLRNPLSFVDDPQCRDYIFLNAERFAANMKVPWNERFKETTFTGDLLRNRMLNEIFHESVPSILHEDDLNAMYFSIENRSPFLDRDLFEFCYCIPTPLMMRDAMNKVILRDSMKGIAPAPVLANRTKIGFNAPIFSLLDVENKSVREQLLDDSPVYDLVKKAEIEKLIGNQELLNSESKFLFSFLNAKIFMEQQRL